MSNILWNPVITTNRYLLLAYLLQGKLEFSRQFNLLFLINCSSAFCVYRNVEFLTQVTLVQTSSMDDDNWYRWGFVFDAAKIQKRIFVMLSIIFSII